VPPFKFQFRSSGEDSAHITALAAATAGLAR
jgi:hypothetical protein